MGERARILVIDDELGIREGCKRALMPQGYAVDSAADGDEGLNRVHAADGGYDLVLLDVMMPGISGIELIGLIHEHDPDIVCIIITGYATVSLAVSAIKHGAYDFLTKPFSADDLLLGVRHGLERRTLSLEAKRLKIVEAEAQRLAIAKARLEELDKSKVAFMHLVTHELQAPAAAVQSYLDLILDGYVPPERQREILERAAERAKEEIVLVSDLLELCRLREAKTQQRPSQLHLDELLREVLEPCENQARQKGLALIADIAEDLPPVWGVAGQLKSLWSNLIGNAIKYTPSGSVEIALHHDGTQIIGQVHDTGIGIPAGARQRLFDEFFRADNAKSLSVHGTGLGLAIVKQVVEDAGGEIWVESEVGRGSTFTFTIPLAAKGREPVDVAEIAVGKGGRMSLRIIDKGSMASFVASLTREYEVVGPRAKDNQFVFGPITRPEHLCLDYTTTILPPKKYLLPQREVMFKFRTEDLSAEPVFDTQPRVIFGAHTCDMHAMRLLDAVFAAGQRDEHYLKRRASTLIVGIECLAPCDENSFCKSMGTLSISEGFDLHLTDLGETYAVEVGTQAGEALLAKHAATRVAAESDFTRFNGVLSEKWPRFSYRLDFEGSELPSLMAVSYRSPVWEELNQRCLACGSCNLVCPTCYCFDVQDDISLDGKTGERYRVWDSCQLDEFARVASGENFRETRAERQRHRFFRKGKYIPEMHGELGCVGCGRCSRACLVDITPVGVWNALHQAHTA